MSHVPSSAGRNIWSLAVNQNENLIATGGGDGSIRLWPLSSPDHNSNAILREARLPSIEATANNQMNTRKTKKEDYPRFVSLLDQFNLLIMTNEGWVAVFCQLALFTEQSQQIVFKKVLVIMKFSIERIVHIREAIDVIYDKWIASIFFSIFSFNVLHFLSTLLLLGELIVKTFFLFKGNLQKSSRQKF